MGLKRYQSMRDFSRTREPESGSSPGTGALRFVVQRHEASKLHYDFRLELEGVLKSWAVPKGPSMRAGDRRLAVEVEDHPFDYRTFRGDIPEGEYGAGHVEIWDEGTYTANPPRGRKADERTLLEGLENGSIKFTLHGKKLSGGFALVRMEGRGKNNWLLIKQRDEASTDTPYDSEEHLEPEPTADAGPARIRPMRATLHARPFDDPDWLFEVKFDGYRALARLSEGEVQLYSRNGNTFNADYPPIVSALEKIPHEALIDGEIVVTDDRGISHFQLLQQYKMAPRDTLYYYAFDLLELDGHDLRGTPLLQRKELLRSIIPEDSRVRYSDHILWRGEAFFREAARGLEGIIAKRASSLYQAGARSDEWRKLKVTARQEAVICGFTKPRGSRQHLGALVLGVYEDGRLKHVGNCGSGFDSASLGRLMARLEPLIQTKSPLPERVRSPTPITWVRPELVCEVEFGGWTQEGQMRHPIFQGLRTDKPAREVVRERPVEETEAMSKPEPKRASREKSRPEPKPPRSPSARSAPPAEGSARLELDGHTVDLTHLERVYFPEDGYTKGDVIAYYAELAPYILPYLKDRPQILHRHPQGIHAQGFFQKEIGDTGPDWLERLEVYAESADRHLRYLVCRDQATLAYMNNLGCIELNPWHVRVEALEAPDWCVLDLDPGENTFDEVIEVALAMKEVLDQAGARSFPKTSGATGLHVYIPLGARYTFEQARDFAHVVSQLVHEKLPKLTSLERSPKARRKQIYLDYLQNKTGQSLASVYSLRPRPGAPASTPLEWKEVKPGLDPRDFTILTMKKRLQAKGDLFKEVLGEGIDMLACLERLAG